MGLAIVLIGVEVEEMRKTVLKGAVAGGKLSIHCLWLNPVRGTGECTVRCRPAQPAQEDGDLSVLDPAASWFLAPLIGPPCPPSIAVTAQSAPPAWKGPLAVRGVGVESFQVNFYLELSALSRPTITIYICALPTLLDLSTLSG